MSDLLAGCLWFVEWYEVADNPNIEYKEVACPQDIINVSGIGTASDHTPNLRSIMLLLEP